MPEKKIVMGNHAVSYGVMLARAEVIAAYPITPQTQIVEELSEICASGRLKAKFIKVESEHSAMACCIGASATGARSFTATSAQGLALMHELLHWAGIGRFPVVLANVNRAMAPGWSIWTEQTDSLSQRDTGWIQLYCETNQEVLDSVILAFKIAEGVSLPVMIVFDAFILSHTYEPVEIPDQESIDRFLPAYSPNNKLDIDSPLAFGALTSPEHNMELRYKLQQAMNESLAVIEEEGRNYADLTGRGYGIVEEFMMDGADTALVAVGSMVSTCRAAVMEMRSSGKKIGLVKLRCFRPFPFETIRKSLKGVKRVVVFDRNLSPGCGGIFASEISSALSCMENAPKVNGVIIGLGGRDITVENIMEGVDLAEKGGDAREIWVGLKKGKNGR